MITKEKLNQVLATPKITTINGEVVKRVEVGKNITVFKFDGTSYHECVFSDDFEIFAEDESIFIDWDGCTEYEINCYHSIFENRVNLLD